MTEKPNANSCGTCGELVAVGAQCAICDVWYHTNRRRNCIQNNKSQDPLPVPYICICCSTIVSDCKLGEPLLQQTAIIGGMGGGGVLGPSSATVGGAGSGRSGSRRRSSNAATTAGVPKALGFAAIHDKKQSMHQSPAGGDMSNTAVIARKGSGSGKTSSATGGLYRAQQERMNETQLKITQYRRHAKKLRGADVLREEYEDQQEDDDVADDGDGDLDDGGFDKSSSFGDTPDFLSTTTGSPFGFESLLGSPSKQRQRSGREPEGGLSGRGAELRQKKKIPLSHVEEAKDDKTEASLMAALQLLTGVTGTETDDQAKRRNDIFYQKNLADRHSQVLSSHRSMYHRSTVTDHLTAVKLQPGGTSPAGQGAVNAAVPARISIVEEVNPTPF